MGKSTVMAQFNRGFGGVEDHRVQFRQLEVVGVGPIANLVGGGNGTNAPNHVSPVSSAVSTFSVLFAMSNPSSFHEV